MQPPGMIISRKLGCQACPTRAMPGKRASLNPRMAAPFESGRAPGQLCWATANGKHLPRYTWQMSIPASGDI